MRLFPFNNGYYLIFRLPFHKSFEMGFQKLGTGHFGIDFGFCLTGTDHAGLRFSIDLFGWLFELNLTDCRHWNYKTDDWMTENEEQAQYEQRKEFDYEQGDLND